MIVDPYALGYSVRILLDSVGPAGHRLTTFEARYPRFIHSELLTHRALSRNTSSSRAIPIDRFIEMVMTEPAMPLWWGRNQPGMQAREALPDLDAIGCRDDWLWGRDRAVETARRLQQRGLHKQVVNRVLEPWLYCTVLVSATDWANFYFVRDHRDAQPELRWIAGEMRRLHRLSVPRELQPGDWHVPLMQPDDDAQIAAWADGRESVRLGDRSDLSYFVSAATARRLQIGTGRCARTSYLTHDGRRDHDRDVELHDRLRSGVGGDDAPEPGHWSPFEHLATPYDGPRNSNFSGWLQARKLWKNENYTGALP